MAGDWIPWCKGLAKKPETLAIARATGMSRHAAAAALMEFWEWVDDQTDTGTIPAATLADLCEFVSGTSDTFWETMVSVGWLAISDDGLTIPKFERWLGRSAKRRLKEARGKRKRRKLSASDADKKRTTGQDRTEEDANASSAAAPQETKPRPPNPLWDAIVTVTGADSKLQARHIGRVCKALREADPPYTPADVLALPRILSTHKFTFPVSLGVVEKYISWTRTPPALPKNGKPEPDPDQEMRARREQAAREARERTSPRKERLSE